MADLTRRDLLRTGLVLSAGTLAGHSARAGTEALPEGDSRLSAPLEPSAAALPAITPRERLLFDFGWRFHLGSDTPPLRNLGSGDDLGAFSKTGTFELATAKLDDSQWRTLDLPHDWAVELPFVHDEALQSHGYKPLGRDYQETSTGWYRRAFDIPAADAGRRVHVEFDGVFRSAMVFLNGCYIGRHDSGYVPCRFDLSDFLDYGGRNFLAVRVDATYGEGWFYEGAGIYRHVWLTKTDPLHLGHCDSVVRCEVHPDRAELFLGTRIENHRLRSETVQVRWQILDADGRLVAQAASRRQPVAQGGDSEFRARARLLSPALWSPESPHLYTAIVSVHGDGGLHDAERVTFGVRTVAFDADRGFLLNGASVKIKGTCNHQDHAGVGVALPDGLQWYRLAALRAMGSNAVRTSHNMPTPEWVAACERMGMMMLCETRQMSSSAAGLAELEVMIKRYRNSPAVILWSMGNEEWVLQQEPQGARIVTSMVRRSRELDPTRLCTAAVNGSYESGVAQALDVVGFNYNLESIDPYQLKHPRRPLIGTETASTVCTRGIYTTDRLRNWVSAYDANHPSWAELAEQWWQFYAGRAYLAGGFAWTGFDYRGEPTPYGWPSVSSQFGILDTCGFPKDNFHYYRAWWGEQPVLHLFPHWNWQERLAEPVAVWVYSNLEEVELLLNGHSLGTQKMPPRGHLQWRVPYQPGVLEARGRRNGQVVLTAKRETTGEPAAIKLTADRSEIRADGEDIAVLRVEALDSAGRPVPTADNLIRFRVSGPGALRGVGNGDPNCQESDQRPLRSLFNGLAHLIIQAGRTPGNILVEAYTGAYPGPVLQPARLIIRAQPAVPRPRVA
jgi:beta-galactosidase